jgi:dipeptide/tripeptide permease
LVSCVFGLFWLFFFFFFLLLWEHTIILSQQIYFLWKLWYLILYCKVFLVTLFCLISTQAFSDGRGNDFHQYGFFFLVVGMMKQLMYVWICKIKLKSINEMDKEAHLHKKVANMKCQRVRILTCVLWLFYFALNSIESFLICTTLLFLPILQLARKDLHTLLIY